MKRITLSLLAAIGCAQASTMQERKEAMFESYKNKRVLVTGGCGFIGSHITRTLVAHGAHVTVLDNLSSGFADHIAPVSEQITFIEGDIRDKHTCLQATKGQEVIFHLAAFVSVPHSVEEPLLCNDINVDGTINMLEAARINNVPRFVFSSSSAVYGQTEGACTEETPSNPTSPYGFSKRIGELLCQQYSINYGIGTICLRYFNVYGERQNPNAQYAAVVAKFNDLMHQDLPVTIFGDGQQTRDFIPVEQVVKANLMMGLLETAQMNGDIFNVATGKSISVIELFEQLKYTHPDYTQTPRFAPARAGDVKHTSAVVTKLNALSSRLLTP